MPEDLTGVPMGPDDRQRLMLLARGEADTMFVYSLIARYDLARSIKRALEERPERVAFMCNPDESGGVETLR